MALLSNRLTHAVLAFVAATLASPIVLAQPRVPDYGAVEGGPSVLLSGASGDNPYNGVVRYQGRASCTGVFIATARSDDEGARAPAYVISNGHCADFPGSNQVILDRPVTNHRVVFDYFADTTGRQHVVPVRRVLFATMKAIDIAILELDARFGDLIAAGFRPWRLSRPRIAAREPVVVVGAPFVAAVGNSYLRLAACRVEGVAPVVLEFIWHWFGAERNGCADVLPGSSGSPVIARGTGRVVGIVNTATTGAQPYTDCYLDHPCEAADGTTASRVATNYASPVTDIVGCFDTDGVFDMARSDCGLDPGVQLTLQPANIGAVNPDLTSVPFGQPRPRWDVALSGTLPYYRYKVVAASDGDCRSPFGYGSPVRVIDRPVIADPLPKTDGAYLLCVIAGDDPRDQRWQRAAHATVVVAVVDHVGPRIPAPISIEGDSGRGHRVTFNATPYQVSSYFYKFGRPSDIHCSDAAGYRPNLIPFIFIATDQGPQLFCAIPFDAAGNPAPVIERLLP